MKIKAVLFDCDGLMFETEIIAQQIWRDECRRCGIELPADFFTHITGSGQRMADYIRTIPGLADKYEQIVAKRYDLGFWKSIHTDCLNKKGLIEIFRYLEANGYRTGICSSSPKEYILGLLDTVSVPLHYDAMITGDMVRHTKPDPEIFLTCAQLLKTETAQCLVLEDSKQGIAAAHNAGMHSCWIYDTIAADDEMKRLLEFKEDSLLDVIPLLEKQAAR